MAEVMKRLCGQGASTERLRRAEDLVRFLHRRAHVGRPGAAPAIVVVGLNAEWGVTGAFAQSRAFGHGGVGPLQLATCAVSLHARLIALAWILPDGAAPPSALELEAAATLGRQLGEIDVVMVDSVIVSGNRWWSCRDLIMSKLEKV